MPLMNLSEGGAGDSTAQHTLELSSWEVLLELQMMD